MRSEEKRSHARILVIDDEPANLKLVDKILRGYGYCNITLIDDPRQVLGHYQAERPNLILLDLNMPHMDGYDVLAMLKELDDPLLPPVVILTAQHGREFKIRALEDGVSDFLGKPFDRIELLMKVRNLLDVHLAHSMLHNQKDTLEAMVRERTEELSVTRLEVVRRLGIAAEYRDNETGQHLERMSQISSLLARHLGWSTFECELMLHASPMHDIGKIGISDQILLKPGKFEPEEWETMKTHTLIGANILDGAFSDLLELAREIAMNHHEKWDGSGYPMALAGEKIPQSARIVAVADVFDALLFTRPYKKAWAVNDAVALIRENSGIHFDPEVVTAFDTCLPQILSIEGKSLESNEIE